MTRILIVDDKADNQYLLEALLSGHGFEVESASHGAEALTRARTTPPDLVISDLLMPVMDGYTLLRHWKADARLRQVPFVAYSATYTEPEDERLAYSLGADAFILKPSEPDVFIVRVREIEANAKAGALARSAGPPADQPDLLSQYSQALVRKLEEKTAQLEETNHALEVVAAERSWIAETQTAILDALPAHIAMIDAEGRILVVNEAWRRFGEANGLRSPDYGIGVNYLAVCERGIVDGLPDAAAAAVGIRQILSGETTRYDVEYSCNAPDQARWFRLIVTPLRIDRREGAVVLHGDTTDRHLAEEASARSAADQRELALDLEAKRARLAEAQAVARLGSWEADLVGGGVTWSDEAHRIFETDPARFQPTYEAFLAMVHPDDRARVNGSLEASFATEMDHSGDHRVRFPDGRIKFVQERWRVFHDNTGRAIRAAGTFQDITDRKTAEDTLRESEERFRQLAETISEVFWITDPTKSQVLYVSPAYEVIWGRPRQELYDNPTVWLDAIHPEHREDVLRAVPKQGDGGYDMTYRVVRPDGSTRWVRDRAFPVRDPAGAVSRIVGLAEDITERTAIEAQFLRAQRMEGIGILAGGIAHDLNNVLTPIMMSIELLRDDDTAEGREETITTIETAAKKGADMVRQVLSFARGVEGRRVEVDVAQLVRDVERIANDTFLKSVRVRIMIPSDLPSVLGDPTQLHQVLLNLCVNARDAMPGGGTMTISARRHEVDEIYAAAYPQARPGAYVAIEVADSGDGMPPAVLERIFEPFYTTKEQGKGTGLGLSTSLSIVKSHGGYVEVQSSPGNGTTFVVHLPAGATGARQSVDGAGAEMPRGQGQTILVVDDEATIREMTRRTLEAFGYQVMLAADGAEAVSIFAEHHRRIAAMLTDLMMPVMGGAATIRAVRIINPTVRIVAVSGMTDSTESLAMEGLGERVHRLPKPYSTDDLLRALDRALRDRT